MVAPSPSPDRLTTAVVLALPTEGAGPLDRLAGLPLALRTVLTLQKEGFDRLYVVVSPTDDRTFDVLASDRRVHVDLQRATAETAPAGLTAPLPALTGASVSGTVLVARHDVVVDPAVYRELATRAAAPTAGAPAHDAPLAHDARALVASRDGVPIGPRIVTFRDGAEVGAEASVVDVAPAWSAHVVTPEGRAEATRQLFEACRKPMDGLVSRRLNRHVSIFISKRLINTPITPNMMSVFTFVLAIVAAASAARGGYLYWLLAAFLLQWNSILDGVDGELARVRFQHSKLGQWLDTLSDDFSNWMFYAALSYSVHGGAVPYGEWLALTGWVGIGAHMVATAQYYAEMIRVGSGDLYAIDWEFDRAPPKGFGGRLLVFWRLVLKRDFALLFFLGVAVAGFLPYVLPIVAGGSIGTLIAATHRNLRQRRGVRGGQASLASSR